MLVTKGDLRTLRLGRSFDAVLVHDAVMYMTSERDLRSMAVTAFQHTRPGGAARSGSRGRMSRTC